MNTIRFAGGLGNQMFQYALYYSLNCAGRKTLANIDYYTENPQEMPFILNQVFPGISINIDKKKLYQQKRDFYDCIRKYRFARKVNYKYMEFCCFFKELENGAYDARLFNLKRAALLGWWQTEKYFKRCREELYAIFSFPFGEKALQELSREIKEYENSICIHVRRGDYLSANAITVYGGICTEDYYFKAMDYLSRTVPDPVFVFFSDDMDWVKKHIKADKAVYIEKSMFQNYQDWYDMFLMSRCSHNIIANSSFSWWGAWLNRNEDKTVVAPAVWQNGCQTRDICPKEWIRM